jgi:hypothetical protein
MTLRDDILTPTQAPIARAQAQHATKIWQLTESLRDALPDARRANREDLMRSQRAHLLLVKALQALQGVPKEVPIKR